MADCRIPMQYVDTGCGACYKRNVKVQRTSPLLVWILLLLAMGPAQGGTLAQFRTAFGDIEVELYDREKPATVGNFVRYVQTGRYTNAFSHLLIPGQILQGGGYTYGNNDIHRVPAYPPIENEFGVGASLGNAYGTLAMAKNPGDTNSATSQWFLNLTNNASFDTPDEDNSFVVFGRVIKGTNVLNVFNSFQQFNGLQQSNVWVDATGTYASPESGSNFTHFPLLYPLIQSSNFVYFDITLLQVAVVRISGAFEVTWNSPAGMTNIVEFTTQFPPVWVPLISTNGTGQRMAILDQTADPKRFYRVRVLY